LFFPEIQAISILFFQENTSICMRLAPGVIRFQLFLAVQKKLVMLVDIVNW